MRTDYDIRLLAAKLGLKEENLIPYGYDKAKIDTSTLSLGKRKAKLILTTAITPTKAGEGKTTTSIGLADGLSLLGEKAMVCLREPSLGPVFGVKGGGAGGGEAVLYPEEDINLHFTGDRHAITSVNNLIAARADNNLYHHRENFNPQRRVFPRCRDRNDRELRHIVCVPTDSKGIEHQSSFVITAASEIMAIFCLSKSEEDFLNRVEDVTIGYTREGKPVLAKSLLAREAFRRLIHCALYPNLVQTKYHTPALVHGGPFANIAHGCSSYLATDLALRLSDYVVTEAGFGSDLGREKFRDILSPLGDFKPDLVVMVASIRALKLHGGVPFDDLKKPNVGAREKGFANLKKHLENVSFYHVPYVVSINHFKDDSEEEITALGSLLKAEKIPYAVNSSYLEGPKGARELAKTVLSSLHSTSSSYAPLVTKERGIKEKISCISKKIYGAKEVLYSPVAEEEIRQYEKEGYSSFSVCISKTPNSLSDDPALLNVPKDFLLHVRNTRLFTGARFIVPLTGKVFTRPGLPLHPSAENRSKEGK